MKANRNIKNLLICSLIVIYIFIYRFFVYTKLLKYNESITASFMIFLLSLTIYFLGYKKISNNKKSKSVIKLIIVSMILYFAITYGIGLITGFLSNSYSLKLSGIVNNLFFIFVTIVCSEIIRYVFIKANKDKKIFIGFITILLILFEINLLVRYDSFNTIQNSFKFVSVTILPIIMKNIMCSYIVYYTNYKGSLLYRVVMDLYCYMVPIQPDLNDLILSISTIVLPFFITISFSKEMEENVQNTTYEYSFIKKTDIPFVIGILVITFMIFGIGPYKIVGIETGSMTPNLNIGDAVIIDKTVNKDKLNEGDIIAYTNKDGILVIHRILKINSDETFITKGDYNNAADAYYVNKEQVKGIVRLKIPFIAYPAIMFK